MSDPTSDALSADAARSFEQGLPEYEPAPAEYLAFKGTPEQQAKLMEAMASARLEFGSIHRDRTGQYGSQQFKYATLGALTEATSQALAKQGIVVVNVFTTSPGDTSRHRLTTWVMGHGAKIEACLDFSPRLEKPEGSTRPFEWIKEYGKLQTYLIRYQYRSLFTLDSEPDADEAPERDERPREVRREAPRPEQRSAPPKPAPVKPAQATLPPKPMEPSPPPASNEVAKPEASPAPTPPPTAPVEKSEPAEAAPVPEPHLEVDDGPCDEATLDRILALYKQLKLNTLTFSSLCQDVAKLPPREVKASAKASRAVLDRLQHMVLDQAQQQGAAS